MGYKWELLSQYRDAHICLEIGLKNIFMYWFALVSGADYEKKYGGARIIGGNKVSYFNKIFFDMLGVLIKLWGSMKFGGTEELLGEVRGRVTPSHP